MWDNITYPSPNFNGTKNVIWINIVAWQNKTFCMGLLISPYLVVKINWLSNICQKIHLLHADYDKNRDTSQNARVSDSYKLLVIPVFIFQDSSGILRDHPTLPPPPTTTHNHPPPPPPTPPLPPPPPTTHPHPHPQPPPPTTTTLPHPTPLWCILIHFLNSMAV